MLNVNLATQLKVAKIKSELDRERHMDKVDKIVKGLSRAELEILVKKYIFENSK